MRYFESVHGRDFYANAENIREEESDKELVKTLSMIKSRINWGKIDLEKRKLMTIIIQMPMLFCTTTSLL